VIDSVDACEGDMISARFFEEGKARGGYSCQTEFFYDIPLMLISLPPPSPFPPPPPSLFLPPPPSPFPVPPGTPPVPTHLAPPPPVMSQPPPTPTMVSPQAPAEDDAASLVSSRWFRSVIVVTSLVYLFLVAGCAYRCCRRHKRSQEDELLEILKRKQLALEKKINDQETKEDDVGVHNGDE
jgi:hypothetical protein